MLKKSKEKEAILIVIAIILTVIFSIYYSLKPDMSVSKSNAYTKLTVLGIIIIIYYLMKISGRKKEK
jgi:hypothetical protein